MTARPIGVQRLDSSKGGPLRVWEFPQILQRSAYVIGADVSEGLPHGDYSAAHVINARSGLVAAHWHGLIEADAFGETLYELGWYYGCALIGVEANNHGLSTLHQLRRDGYPNLFRRRSVQKDFNTVSHQLGWYTSRVTKPLMLDELARSLRNGELELHCPETIKELLGFVRDTDDGSLHGSPHDDRVMSLAIANQMRAFAFAPEYQPNQQAPEWSWEWWSKLKQDGTEKDSKWVIGSGSIRK